MPLHDWLRVGAGEYHDFHNAWIVALRTALNTGGLPQGYYALGEQQALLEDDEKYVPDVLALERVDDDTAADDSDDSRGTGGLAVAVAPPLMSLQATSDIASFYSTRRRTLAIRHSSDDRPVALVEIASPGNKDRRSAVSDFVDKCLGTLDDGLHLVVIDPFPPRANDLDGLALRVAEAAGQSGLTAPPGRRVPAVSFESATVITAYAEPFGVGDALPPLPLFYKIGWYVPLPLEATYDVAFAGLPKHLRRRLETE